MSQHDRDFITACLVIILALMIFWMSLTLPMRGELIESPAIFPGLMSVVLFILGIVFAIRSLNRGGRIKIARLCRSATPLLTSEKNRPFLLGILFPGFYVFLAIPFLGFYVASALFMTVMFYAYVKKWRRCVFLPVSIGVTVGLYLIFNKLFMVQIW